MLSKAFGTSLYKNKENPADVFWPLSDASDRISALKLPDVPWLALFFAIYALIAGPIFYFVLRRKRKQSYMWAVVPVFAIVTGIGVFTYGAFQRSTSVIVNSAGYIQFQQSGQANGLEAAAIFVPRGDDYEAEVKGDGRVWSLAYNRGNETEPKTWLSAQPDFTTAQFHQVEFWSVRKLGMARTIPDAGSFVSDLSYHDGKLGGTVTNKTKYTLHNVRIVSGQAIQELADLAPDASVQIDLAFNAQMQMTPGRRTFSNKMALLPQSLKSKNPEESREWTILDMLDQSRQSRTSYSSGVMLLGWSNQPIHELEVKNEKVRGDHLTLITAQLPIKPSPDGTVFYPPGTFEAVMTENTSDAEEVDNGYQMKAGDITFEFHLDAGKKLHVSKLNMYTWSQDKTLFDKQVYNWQKKDYESFDQAFVNNTLTDAKVAPYLSPDGTLRVKFSHSLDVYGHIGIPVISVEGKVVQP
jgi:hypothetical protein